MNKKFLIGILVVVLALILAFCAIPRDDATKPAENTTVPFVCDCTGSKDSFSMHE